MGKHIRFIVVLIFAGMATSGYTQSLKAMEKFNMEIERARKQNCSAWLNGLRPNDIESDKRDFIGFMIDSLLQRANTNKYEKIMIMQGDVKKMSAIMEAFVTICKAHPTTFAWDAAEKAYEYFP